MKELRASVGGKRLRVLFAFDPRSAAVLLLGGDKTGRWQTWYQESVPQADEQHRAYLDELRDEGSMP